MKFLLGFLTQLIATVGTIYFFGFIIAFLRHAFCVISGKNGNKILLVAGIIGTPIHELSHAAMCLIFGHRITKIKLFQPHSDNGTLGYVDHTYNKKNIYHQTGNFFIGIAPIVIGGGILVLFMYLLVPNTFYAVTGEIAFLNTNDITTFPISDLFYFIYNSALAIFSSDNLLSWQGWLFITIAFMISIHMEMSRSDIKSSLKGLLFIIIFALIIDGAIYLISPQAFDFINLTAISFGFIFSAFLSISVIFTALLLIIAIIVKGLVLIIKH